MRATLFIPRVLPSVTKKTIANKLYRENIGDCVHIKSKYRKNEKGFDYWFAFITIEFFDTKNARLFIKHVIEQEETIAMDYFDTVLNKEMYWEISLRNLEKKNNVLSVKSESVKPTFLEEGESVKPTFLEEGESVKPTFLEEGEILETVFREMERQEIYQDYLELERDIFGSNYICV
jgi:hypothetical protein